MVSLFLKYSFYKVASNRFFLAPWKITDNVVSLRGSKSSPKSISVNDIFSGALGAEGRGEF